MYRRRETPEEPPCGRCRVDLAGGNETDARVYMLTRRQVVTAGMGQVVDISIPAVKIAMDLLGVVDQVACLTRVLKVFHHFLGKSDES